MHHTTETPNTNTYVHCLIQFMFLLGCPAFLSNCFSVSFMLFSSSLFLQLTPKVGGCNDFEAQQSQLLPCMDLTRAAVPWCVYLCAYIDTCLSCLYLVLQRQIFALNVPWIYLSIWALAEVRAQKKEDQITPHVTNWNKLPCKRLKGFISDLWKREWVREKGHDVRDLRNTQQTPKSSGMSLEHGSFFPSRAPHWYQSYNAGHWRSKKKPWHI